MRRWGPLWTAIAIIAAVLLFGLGPAGRAHTAGTWLAIVRLHADANVRGPNILLAEIAEIETEDEQLRTELQQLVVGRAPLPGQRREVHGATVRTRMRQQRLPVNQILLEPEGHDVVVHTRSVTIAGDALVDFVLKDLVEHRSLPPSDYSETAQLDFTCATPSSVRVADGEPLLRVQRVSGSPPGSLMVLVDIIVNEALERSVPVRCDAVLETEVVVATTTLKRHDLLQHDVYEIQIRRFTSLPRDGLLPHDAPEGWRITRPVAAGTVLTFGMVEPRPVVKRGDAVSIIAEVAGIVVTVPGIALADGGNRELIQVENAVSGQIVQAYVVDEETVAAVMH